MYVSFKVIGSHIRDARKAKGLTQEQFAERLGLSTLHYGRLERGDRPASLEQIARIADELGISTLSLLSGSLTHEPLSAEPTTQNVSFADRLSRMTSACTAQELEMLEEICQVFTQNRKPEYLKLYC